jgi:RNA polymerase sigma-70 factor, ECF subfamily
LPESDQRQIDQIAAGRPEAFEAVYRAHKDGLLTATLLLLRGDRIAAEDVLHDVFVQLAQQAPSLRLKSSLRNYLTTCCLNRARDSLRRQSVHRRAIDTAARSVSAQAVPSSEMESQEQQTQIVQLLSRLPDDQREVVTLRIQREMTFQEIADTAGISVNTAKSRYRYALAKLQQWWPADRVESGEM